MLIVSACLAGVRSRHDGTDSRVDRITELVARGEALPVCPEQLGGLPTPRRPAAPESGDGQAVLGGSTRVIDSAGKDVTENFIRGAHETLALARLIGAERAVFRQGSPSCGCGRLSVGGRRCDGDGVTTALLKMSGIAVESDEGWS